MHLLLFYPRKLEPLANRSDFRFSPGHFLYTFTLYNSNNVCQYMTSQNKQCMVVQNIKIILKHMWTLQNN